MLERLVCGLTLGYCLLLVGLSNYEKILRDLLSQKGKKC